MCYVLCVCVPVVIRYANSTTQRHRLTNWDCLKSISHVIVMFSDQCKRLRDQLRALPSWKVQCVDDSKKEAAYCYFVNQAEMNTVKSCHIMQLASKTLRERLSISLDSFLSQWIRHHWPSDSAPSFTSSTSSPDKGRIDHFVLLWTKDKEPVILAALWFVRFTKDFHRKSNRYRMYVQELESTSLPECKSKHFSPTVSLPMALVAMCAD